MSDSSQFGTGIDSEGDTGHSAANRRAFLGAVGAASAGALAGCTSMLGGGGGSETLRVTTWSGNYGERFEKAIKPIFEERTGAELRVNLGWEEILAKIKAAPKDDPPYDVTVTEGQLYHLGRQDDLFLPIRYDENVPNIEHVIPYYKNVRTPKYGAPTDGAPTCILYRNDLSESVTEWQDLQAEFVAQSSGVGIDSGFWVFPLHAAGIATQEMEGAKELYQSDAHDAVFETLKEWPIEGWASSGTDIWQQFDNGIIDAAQWYLGQVYYDIGDHEGIEFSVPETNTGYMNNYSVVRGTDKRDLAEEFLNILLDPEVQTEWSKQSPTLFTTEGMEYAGDLGEYLPRNQEEAKKMVLPDWSELSDDQSEFSQRFKQMKTGQ